MRIAFCYDIVFTSCMQNRPNVMSRGQVSPELYVLWCSSVTFRPFATRPTGQQNTEDENGHEQAHGDDDAGNGDNIDYESTNLEVLPSAMTHLQATRVPATAASRSSTQHQHTSKRVEKELRVCLSAILVPPSATSLLLCELLDRVRLGFLVVPPSELPVNSSTGSEAEAQSEYDVVTE
jgi:hypothetical protein